MNDIFKDRKTPGSQECKTKYVRNSKTISGRLHDEMVMMDIEQGKYFSLNPVATRIWDLLESPLALDELCLALMEEYEVDTYQCRSDVEEHLDQMISLGLIIRQS
ncbi:MAG TPA: PqqD family protein [Bacteroidales bacterium]|nr:PqqD family protein [Bacteroidales bacterium]